MVVPSIQRLCQILSALHELGEHDADALHFIETETDMSLPFWREVHEARRDRKCEKPAEIEPKADPNDFQHGMLVIKEIGSQGLKVVQIFRRALDVSLAEALALAAQREIVVGRGVLSRLRRLQEQLTVLGASTESRPDTDTVT